MLQMVMKNMQYYNALLLSGTPLFVVGVLLSPPEISLHPALDYVRDKDFLNTKEHYKVDTGLSVAVACFISTPTPSQLHRVYKKY